MRQAESVVPPPNNRAVAGKGSRRHTAGGLLVSGLSLVACVWWALHQTAPTFPTSLTALAILAGAISIYAIAVAARGYRWARILGYAAISTKPIEPYCLLAVGYMGNTVLPARGGEVLRVLLLTERSNARWQESLGSIIPERLLDFTALAFLLGLVTFAGVGGTPVGTAPAQIAALVILAGVALGFAALYLRARGRLTWIPDRARPFIRASRLLFTPEGLALLLLTLAIWTLEAIVFWLIGRSLSISIEPMGALMVLVIASVFSIIPAGPAYAGTYDAALLLALRALGVAGGAALAFLLMVRFVIFVPVTVVGLLLIMARYGGLGRLRGNRARDAVSEIRTRQATEAS